MKQTTTKDAQAAHAEQCITLLLTQLANIRATEGHEAAERFAARQGLDSAVREAGIDRMVKLLLDPKRPAAIGPDERLRREVEAARARKRRQAAASARASRRKNDARSELESTW